MSEAVTEAVTKAQQRAAIQLGQTVVGAIDAARTAMAMAAATGDDIERHLGSVESHLRELASEGRRVRSAINPDSALADAQSVARSLANRLGGIDEDLGEVAARLGRATEALSAAQDALLTIQDMPGQDHQAAAALESRLERLELAVNTAASGTGTARSRVETARSILARLANQPPEVSDREQSTNQIVDASADVRLETEATRQWVSGARDGLNTQKRNGQVADKRSQELLDAMRVAALPPAAEGAQRPGSAAADSAGAFTLRPGQRRGVERPTERE
ncbi:MAG TPA: hypothetical protein VFB74_06285 [Kribbellaceae bacterium]|nr:hypothetical protein [Kribbellaceae bacterium]